MKFKWLSQVFFSFSSSSLSHFAGCYLCRQFVTVVYVVEMILVLRAMFRSFLMFVFIISEFAAFMRPEPDYDYYNEIAEEHKEIPDVLNPMLTVTLKPVVIQPKLSKFERCKIAQQLNASRVVVRTTHTTITATVK